MTIKQTINITLIMILGLFLMLTIGCQKSAAESVELETCVIKGAFLVCPDGSEYELSIDDGEEDGEVIIVEPTTEDDPDAICIRKKHRKHKHIHCVKERRHGQI